MTAYIPLWLPAASAAAATATVAATAAAAVASGATAAAASCDITDDIVRPGKRENVRFDSSLEGRASIAAVVPPQHVLPAQAAVVVPPMSQESTCDTQSRKPRACVNRAR